MTLLNSARLNVSRRRTLRTNDYLCSDYTRRARQVFGRRKLVVAATGPPGGWVEKEGRRFDFLGLASCPDQVTRRGLRVHCLSLAHSMSRLPRGARRMKDVDDGPGIHCSHEALLRWDVARVEGPGYETNAEMLTSLLKY
jgi:hypothetical protein